MHSLLEMWSSCNRNFIKLLMEITKLQSCLPTVLAQRTNKCLNSIHFSSSDIDKIISPLDPIKSHGHDMLSIRMIKSMIV